MACAVLGACALIALANVLVNPFGYYPCRFLPPVAWSSRSEKIALMREAPAPAVLIVGSSRSMKLAPDVVARSWGPSFNASVDSARVEDYYALVGFALDLGWRPRDLFIGLDVEALHDHVPMDPRLVGAPELRSQLPGSFRRRGLVTMGEELLTEQQTTESVHSLLRRLRLRPVARPQNRFDPNGELHYTRWEEEIRLGTFRPDLANSIANYDTRYTGFTALDRERAALLRETVEMAVAKGMRVHVFLTPLHPRLIEHLRKERHFDVLRAAVVELAGNLARAVPNTTFTDFTEVQSFGGSADAFYDGAHVRDENAALLVEALRRRADGEATHALQ